MANKPVRATILLAFIVSGSTLLVKYLREDDKALKELKSRRLVFGEKAEKESLVSGYCVRKLLGPLKINKPEGYENRWRDYVTFKSAVDKIGEGCLVVNGKKHSLREDGAKGKGLFRGEGVLRYGERAVILSGGIRNSTKKKNQLEGDVNLLAIAKGERVGLLKHIIEKPIKIDHTNYRKHFPTGFKKDEFEKDKEILDKRNGGFAPWYAQACKGGDMNGDCNFTIGSGTKPHIKIYEWKMDKEGTEKFSDLHENFDVGGATVFKKELNMLDYEHKMGKWKEVL